MATTERTIRRLPSWADWLVALAGAVVLFNLNVTDRGDPLSGMTDDTRLTFYAVLAIVGTIALCTAVLSGLLRPMVAGNARRAAAGVGFLALSGIAGLLLDQRDGPVRTVQLIVYVGVFIAVVRFVRLVIGLADTGEPSTIDRRPAVETGPH